MKNKQLIITILVLGIALLSGYVCIMGIMSGLTDSTVAVITPLGEKIQYQAEGVYSYNPRWFVAEGIGWDLATLFVGLPLMLLALVFYNRGSLKAGVVLGGMLAYFFYQFIMYATGWAYNQFFLLYTLLYSISGITLALLIQAIGVEQLAGRIKAKYPRRSLAVFMFFVAFFITFLWIGRILPAALSGQTPDLLRGQHTLVIQAFDLGLLVPFAIFSGVLLLKKNSWGILMASVGIVKFCMMAFAVEAMVIVRSLVEKQFPVGEGVMFLLLGLFGGVFLYLLMQSIGEPKGRISQAKRK